MVMKDQGDMIKGAVIAGAGIFGINYVFNLPCSVQANPMIGLTAELVKIVCLSKDAQTMIIMMVASAAVFAGITKLVKNI